MLGLQQELGAAIAEQIRFRLSPQRFEALARREPRVAAAYDEYLRGLTFANQRTPATIETGDRALRTCDDARSRIRVGLVGAGVRTFGEAHQ